MQRYLCVGPGVDISMVDIEGAMMTKGFIKPLCIYHYTKQGDIEQYFFFS